MVVGGLATEESLGASHHPLAADDYTVNPVAGVVSQRETDGASFAFGAAEGMLVERAVLPRGPPGRAGHAVGPILKPFLKPVWKCQ